MPAREEGGVDWAVLFFPGKFPAASMLRWTEFDFRRSLVGCHQVPLSYGVHSCSVSTPSLFRYHPRHIPYEAQTGLDC